MKQFTKTIKLFFIFFLTTSFLSCGASDDGSNNDALSDDEKAFFQSAKNGDVEVMRDLLDKGIDPNLFEKKPDIYDPLPEKMPESVTALGHASMYGHLKVIELLLSYGVDTELFENRMALFYAVDHRHLEIMKVLLENGIDPDLTPSDFFGYLKHEFMAFIRSPHIHNFRPLMLASKQGDLEIVKVLLEHGAKVNWESMKVKNGVKHYKTAMDFAIENGHKNIELVLKEHGGKALQH